MNTTEKTIDIVELKSFEVIRTHLGMSLRGSFTKTDENDNQNICLGMIWAKPFKKGMSPKEVTSTLRDLADNIDRFFKE